MWARPIISQDRHRLQLHWLLTAVTGIEVTSSPSTLGMTNAQSTPMTTNPSISEGEVQLATDLLASAMSESVFKNSHVPLNWWGYGMPPEFMANSSGTSQVADMTGKGPMASAPPVSPMAKNPSILQLPLQDLLLGILKYQDCRCSNASYLQCRRIKCL